MGGASVQSHAGAGAFGLLKAVKVFEKHVIYDCPRISYKAIDNIHNTSVLLATVFDHICLGGFQRQTFVANCRFSAIRTQIADADLDVDALH